ncbi:MAG TPA: PHP domain-containing protein [Candidatus Paceibacterota bacterium]|nr:PHP domain-containing protein [Verrucomicrobiota bacterium]HRY47732.1 PHP domain-containing protein [Candidatus Paceibacterota bacterium]HSA03288.1 PHP domain-containing protein [Candidatus Paceibacterota bacterium]
MKFADLHLHTFYSDGTYSPEELAARASRAGFAAISLTDHDTLEGCPATAEACKTAGIEFIPGTELTAEIDDHEIHLLGYGIDASHTELSRQMAKFQHVRQDRIREMVARLNRLNIPLQAEDVFTLANCRSPGRPHVGRALVAAGFCSGIDEAFERFLKKHRPAWVPKYKMSVSQAIQLIHDAGGLAVLAHPGLSRIDDYLPLLAGGGLDGLECFHSQHSATQTERYQLLARQYHLLITGGSDCHGRSRGKPTLGSVRLPMEFVDLLKDRWELLKGSPERTQSIEVSPPA